MQETLIRAVGMAAVSLAAAFPATAHAQSDEAGSPLQVEGSVRVRGEAIGGQFRNKGPESDALIAVQTIVRAEYDAGVVRIGAELIDGRTYGQKFDSIVGTADNNALEPVQAWIAADLASIFGTRSKAELQVGRFTMDIGSGRLVGRAGYPASPNSFAGARFDWKGKGGAGITAFWTLPFDRLPTGSAAADDHGVELDHATTDRQFFGAYASIPVGKQGPIDFYGLRLFERDAPGYQTRNRRLATFGARLTREPAANAFDYEIEGAWQTGKVRGSAAVSDVTDIDVSAAMFHADAGWSFAGAWKPHVSLVFDFATGDGPDPSKYGRFDPLFGKRRGEFGPTTLYGPLSYSNLIAAGVSFDTKPSKTWSFFVKPRALWLASATDSFASTGIRDAAGTTGRFAGVQTEAMARTWLVPKRLQLELGGAWLAKGSFLQDAPNVKYRGDTRYGYVALTAKF